MVRLMTRMRRTGLALLASFVVQALAIGFCALPRAQAGEMPAAASAGAHEMAHAICPMDMPAEPGHSAPLGMPHCDHCQTPSAALAATPAFDAPSLAMLAILPEPQALPASSALPNLEESIRTELGAPPDSASLIFRQTLRIRI